jgi:hypothetical protein
LAGVVSAAMPMAINKDFIDLLLQDETAAGFLNQKQQWKGMTWTRPCSQPIHGG